MSPPCHTFTSSELSTNVQADVKGKRRKLPDGAKNVDLSACELLEMSQWKCAVQKPVTRDSQIECFETLRFFRRCADRKGPFMVETSSWEGRQFPNSESARKTNEVNEAALKPEQWSSSWVDANSAGPS